MSRATLLGRVERLSGEALAEATERFALTHNGRTGVDAVQATDLYFCLNVERVFFVGGLGSVRRRVGRRRRCAALGDWQALSDVGCACRASSTETHALVPSSLRRTRARRWCPATRTAARCRTRCADWRRCLCGR